MKNETAAPVTSDRTPAFRADRCTLCGECLRRCPVMRLPVQSAKKEMRKLLDGDLSSQVLSRCTTCFSCDLYCPEDARPYRLILERWNDLYKKRGAPPLYRFVCPTEKPNIWQLLNIFLPENERAWVDEWVTREPGPGDRVLLIGSYTHLFPFVIGGSALLDGYVPVSRPDQWEGGAYLYQGGYLDEVRRIALRCEEDFLRWEAASVTPALDAVRYLYTKVHPGEMGVAHSGSFPDFHRSLLDGLGDGSVPVRHRLGLTVTVHDNCYSKALGDDCWETPRRILEKCGCTLLEMEHIRADALCCGFGAGASWVRNFAMPFDIIAEGAKKFREAEATGATALVSYCGGCLYLLWAARELLGSKMDVYHLVEVVRMAMGEKLNYPDDHLRRAWDIIAIISYQLLVSLFQRKFRIGAISYDVAMSTFKPGKYPLLRLIRWSFRAAPVRLIYARLFRRLMPLLSTRKAAP